MSVSHTSNHHRFGTCFVGADAPKRAMVFVIEGPARSDGGIGHDRTLARAETKRERTGRARDERAKIAVKMN
jgi:hypothetical protein